MIYLPKGLKNGEVVDPDKMAQDLQKPTRLRRKPLNINGGKMSSLPLLISLIPVCVRLSMEYCM